MFYIEQENKIVLFDEDRQRLQKTLLFAPQYAGLEIQEVQEGYTIVDYQLVTIEEEQELKAEKRQQAFLKDFFKVFFILQKVLGK